MAWKQLCFTSNAFWYATGSYVSVTRNWLLCYISQNNLRHCVFVVLFVVHHRAADLRNPTPSASNSTPANACRAIGGSPAALNSARLQAQKTSLGAIWKSMLQPLFYSDILEHLTTPYQVTVLCYHALGEIAPHQKILSWNSIISLCYASCNCF